MTAYQCDVCNIFIGKDLDVSKVHRIDIFDEYEDLTTRIKGYRTNKLDLCEKCRNKMMKLISKHDKHEKGEDA